MGDYHAVGVLVKYVSMKGNLIYVWFMQVLFMYLCRYYLCRHYLCRYYLWFTWWLCDLPAGVLWRRAPPLRWHRSLLEGTYDLCPGTGCDVARDVPARLWVSMIYVYRYSTYLCMVSFTYRNVNDKLLLFITILLNCILQDIVDQNKICYMH